MTDPDAFKDCHVFPSPQPRERGTESEGLVAWAVLDMGGEEFHSVHIFKEDAERAAFGLGTAVKLKLAGLTLTREKLSEMKRRVDGLAQQIAAEATKLPEILPGPGDRSGRTGKRDRQRLQSAFKKGVKEGRRIEREAAQNNKSTSEDL